MKQDDLYIAILKYGKEHIGENVTPGDIKKYFKENNYEIDVPSGAFQRLFFDVFSDPKGRGFNDNLPCIMNMEAYFRLLEHEELKEARQSSKEARKYAIIAICISIIAMVISIIFSIIQIITPTKIDNTQFQKLIQPASQSVWQSDEK